MYAETLVTRGFFAHSRNPLYLGNFLVLLGLFVIYNNPWVYALGVAFFAVTYRAIVAAEVGLITTSVTYYFKKKDALAAACEHALAKDPAARPPSAAAFARLLRSPAPAGPAAPRASRSSVEPFP